MYRNNSSNQSIQYALLEFVLGRKFWNKESEIIDLAVKCEFIEKSGSWFSYKGEKMGQGRENVCQYLKENPEKSHELEQKIRAHYGLAGSN